MFLAKRNNGYYFVEFQDLTSGKPKRISTGTKNHLAAANFANRLTNENAVKNKSAYKISDFHTEYMNCIGSTHSKKYIISIRMSFKQLIDFHGDTSIEKITARLAQQFVTKTFMRTKHGANLVNRTLKAAFNFAVEWGYITENPFKKVRLPKIEKNVPLFINEADLAKIISVTKREDLKNLFLFAFYTGMRLGEILNLRWKEIDLITKVIYVKNSREFTTKSKKERAIPISGKLFNVLSEIEESSPDDYVFSKCKGIHLNGDYSSKLFKDAVILAGLNPKIHFHTLRHSFASNLVQRGASLYVVKELLGHGDITTTQIYSHLQKDNLIQAVKLLD